MTREEARELLQTTPIDIRSPRDDLSPADYFEALKLAIEALQERPKGRWIELPCAIGDKLYDISGKIATVNEILIDAYRTTIHVNFECDHNCKLCAFNSWHQDYSGEYECSGEWGHGYIEGVGEIGKTLFFTAEEAEKALADMRGEKLTLDSVITGLEEMLNTADKLIKDIDKTSNMMENFGADMRESEQHV